MQKFLVLFNPLSDSGNGERDSLSFSSLYPDAEIEYRDIRTVEDWKALIESLGNDTVPVIAGGDGTLNRAANNLILSGLEKIPDIYYFAAGSGNDFFKDIGGKPGDKPVLVNRYIENLPYVTLNDKDTCRFINGIGFGIDGYCCEEGDRQRAAGKKKINYTAIALKGLFGKYSSKTAKVTVDGKEYKFDNVWLAPIMHGRYFGGGMMPTPHQDRLDPDTISVMLYFDPNRLRTLMNFPKLFSDKHLSLPRDKILTGHDITVEYETPTALQIDGETVLGVTKCRCRTEKAYLGK